MTPPEARSPETDLAQSLEQAASIERPVCDDPSGLTYSDLNEEEACAYANSFTMPSNRERAGCATALTLTVISSIIPFSIATWVPILYCTHSHNTTMLAPAIYTLIDPSHSTTLLPLSPDRLQVSWTGPRVGVVSRASNNVWWPIQIEHQFDNPCWLMPGPVYR